MPRCKQWYTTLVAEYLLKIQELFTLCSNEWVMKIGTDSCQKLSNEYFVCPVMGNEMKMYAIWAISNENGTFLWINDDNG